MLTVPPLFRAVTHSQHGLSTANLATPKIVPPATVVKRYCTSGTYHGVLPRKLANRRLLWPDVIVASSGPVRTPSAVPTGGQHD
mgnify:CR=1 FL=1